LDDVRVRKLANIYIPSNGYNKYSLLKIRSTHESNVRISFCNSQWVKSPKKQYVGVYF